MKNLGIWALENRKLVYFLVFVLLLGGAISYNTLSKLEDPELVVKQALVITVYPGASAHQVELEVTDPLEKGIRSMKEVDEVSSRSMNDLSMISVGLKTTVQNDEVEQCWDLLRRKVSDARRDLPDGAATPVVMDNFGDVYGMVYALTFEGYSDLEAERYAGLIQRKIKEIDGISDVTFYGKRNECVYIGLLEDRMANLGVLPVEVLSTLNGQNQTVYSGYYESGDRRLRVSVNDKYKTVEDIGNLFLQGHEKDQLRLRDIATVTQGYEAPVRNELRYDGTRALGISISAMSGTDITKIGKKVDRLLAALAKEQLPAGMEFHKVFFQPERVEASLNTFMINLVESVLIVIFLLMLTMGFRSGLIIGMSLVTTVLGSLFILNLFDGTLQRVSVGSFILAMGMLVDNAIVIIDGIQVDLQRGAPRRQALTSIGKRTAMPLLGATLIAILAFLPIFLSPDTAGIYVRDLFIVLAVSLLLSWLLALTLSPLQAGRFLKIKKEAKELYDNRFYRILRKTLSWALSHRALTVLIGILLLLSSLLCYRFLPQGFFPDMDYDQLYIEYKLPEGMGGHRVKSDLEEIEKYLLAREEITHVTTSIGGTPSRYNLVRSIADPSLSYGELIVDYASSGELVSTMEEIQEHLTCHYPEAYIRLKRYNLMYKKYPVEVEFCGPDPAVLRDLTAQAQEIMRSSPDLFLINSDWEAKVPGLEVDYDQPVARSLGLSRQDVALSLLAATDGIPVGTFYEGTHRQTLYLQCVDKEGKPLASLENAPLFGMMPSLATLDPEMLKGLMAGLVSEEDLLSEIFKTTPLGQATKGIRLVWEEPVVIRHNGERAMRAQCNNMPGVAAENARKSIAKEIENMELPDGYSMRWEGEKSASEQSMAYLFQYYPLAIVLIIAILILLFKDYKKPLIILLCIPLMLVGVIFGMWMSGKTFGFVAIVATLGLMGMIIKNGIVLMDEISSQINSGVEPVKALLDSSAQRFRPVMMASLTTILGMLPLINDPLFGPGAVSIMGGLLVGTLITLLFIPVLYALFFGVRGKP